jgi:hypothetical protein
MHHSAAANCYEALRHLRYDLDRKDPGKEADGSVALWVDFICIGQSNTPEKNAQFLLMGDIYSLAQSVCIWLGPRNSTIDCDMNIATFCIQILSTKHRVVQRLRF